MSKTVHHQHRTDNFGRRQPRPAARRSGTRASVIRAALLEG
jgi:hypothetical protein